ncbi:unnamed protein product [Lota lota]
MWRQRRLLPVGRIGLVKSPGQYPRVAPLTSTSFPAAVPPPPPPAMSGPAAGRRRENALVSLTTFGVADERGHG